MVWRDRDVRFVPKADIGSTPAFHIPAALLCGRPDRPAFARCGGKRPQRHKLKNLGTEAIIVE